MIIKIMYKLQLQITRVQLRVGTILWTQGPLPSIVLDQNLLPSSCAILISKGKKVSSKLVSADLFVRP